METERKTSKMEKNQSVLLTILKKKKCSPFVENVDLTKSWPGNIRKLIFYYANYEKTLFWFHITYQIDGVCM